MSNIIHNFIQYKCSLDNRLKKENLGGATQEDIMKLENIIGYPLPDIYKEYLLRVGRVGREDLFFYSGYLEMAIDAITDYNEEIVKFESKFKPNSLIIGYMIDEEMDIGLKYSSVEEDPKVVRMDSVEFSDTIADSFSNFLFQKSFLQVSILFKYMHVFIVDNEKEENILKLIPKFDFERQWFSDSVNYLGIKKDKKALFFREKTKDYTALYAYYDDHSGIESFISAIKKAGAKEIERKKQDVPQHIKNRVNIP